jgi:hypothetical protein
MELHGKANRADGIFWISAEDLMYSKGQCEKHCTGSKFLLAVCGLDLLKSIEFSSCCTSIPRFLPVFNSTFLSLSFSPFLFVFRPGPPQFTSPSFDTVKSDITITTIPQLFHSIQRLQLPALKTIASTPTSTTPTTSRRRRRRKRSSKMREQDRVR